MGTRNLTAVVLNKKYVLAQYGQWDGYPGGQGATALTFCRKRLKTTAGRKQFKAKLANVRFAKEGEIERLAESVGSKDGMVTMEQGKKLNQLAPYISRDIGATILELVWNAEGEVMVNDSSKFATDSLFCEFAYVIDLDRRTFEAYKGFQTEPLPKSDRFANMPPEAGVAARDTKYYPVRMVGSWSLDALPTQRALEKVFGRDYE